MTTSSDFVPAPHAAPPVPDATYAGHPDRRDRFLDDPRKKSVWVASLLSLMPGLGQVYVGYYPEGFKNIAVICASIAIAVLLEDDGGPIVGLFIAFYWLHNIIDAGRRASLYNQALAGLRPMDLPEDVKYEPRLPGSFAGGVALIVAGLVLASHTLAGLSLEWVRDWWPVALIIVGAWLVYKDRMGKGTDGGQ